MTDLSAMLSLQKRARRNAWQATRALQHVRAQHEEAEAAVEDAAEAARTAGAARGSAGPP